jgi:actin-like ATPase involved in cell morphogenesis
LLIWTKRNPEAEAVILVEVGTPAVDIPVEVTAIPAEVTEDGAHPVTATAEALSADLGAVSSAALPDPWGHLVAMDTYIPLAAIDLISLTGHLADMGIPI